MQRSCRVLTFVRCPQLADAVSGWFELAYNSVGAPLAALDVPPPLRLLDHVISSCQPISPTGLKLLRIWDAGEYRGTDLDSLLAHTVEAVASICDSGIQQHLGTAARRPRPVRCRSGLERWDHRQCDRLKCPAIRRLVTSSGRSDRWRSAIFAATSRFTVSPLHRQHNLISSVLVPLYGQERPLGVLTASSLQPRVFSSEEIAWLQVLANILSARLERKWLRQGENDKQLLTSRANDGRRASCGRRRARAAQSAHLHQRADSSQPAGTGSSRSARRGLGSD